ncbi:hypothetical protein Xcom_07270 [Xanthomonas axonopodis pv. commiphoreae]|nr:hypothetical protein Xcom_07270 [Xanthomonas axonopodis pv. commiphoreae]
MRIVLRRLRHHWRLGGRHPGGARGSWRRHHTCRQGCADRGRHGGWRELLQRRCRLPLHLLRGSGYVGRCGGRSLRNILDAAF